MIGSVRRERLDEMENGEWRTWNSQPLEKLDRPFPQCKFSVLHSPFPILHCGGGRIADRRRVQGVVPDQSAESVDGQWAAQESERIKMQRARRIGLLS
jgi:hypothetical protein